MRSQKQKIRWITTDEDEGYVYMDDPRRTLVLEDEDEEVEEEEEEEEEEVEEEEEEEEEGKEGGEGEHSQNDDEEEEEAPIDGCISVMLSNPSVLDCCICFEPLTIPVFQCDNGHIACSTCCAHQGKNCPTCFSPIGYNRCRPIEKVLESIKISCMNAKYGCKETLSYSEKNDHEKKCLYVPCFCPNSGCDFVASSKELSLHFCYQHGDSIGPFIYDHTFYVFLKSKDEAIVLQEQTDGNLFILNNNVVPLGNVVNIGCIGPNSSKPGHQYDILARSRGCSLKLESFTKNIQRSTVGTPSSGFLLIPFDYFGSSGSGLLRLEIRIRY